MTVHFGGSEHNALAPVRPAFGSAGGLGVGQVHGNNIDAARHPRQIVRIPCDVNIEVNSILRVDFS